MWESSLGQGGVLVEREADLGLGQVLSSCPTVSSRLLSPPPPAGCARLRTRVKAITGFVPGWGPFWELPLSLPLSQSQISKAVGSLTLRRDAERPRGFQAGSRRASSLGEQCGTLGLWEVHELLKLQPSELSSSLQVSVFWWGLGAQGLCVTVLTGSM